MYNPYQAAQDFLRAIDNDWAQLIDQVGTCKFTTKSERDPYEALVRAVAYQQLSTKAGDAILKKLINHYGHFPAPPQLLTTTFDELRAVGFSGRKIETLQGIASAALSGLVPTQALTDNMSNETLIQQITTIKGIGQWTVEMMLMFTLARMDILPADDFGIVEGYKRLKKLEVAPKRKQMAEIGLAWSPYRTVASWYLWQVPK
ncbi:DNA-3-methyladenine glycosylase family protein [Methylotenera mobilis]|uniref:DNA-3-methyladenine glycosylase II n=1 Tax=Methylotenera mobilis (strain JLW8 / ATCC BAA-1282 / DSM 17540) TaxID=583345 RepID=C6WYS1_METML|nr:DNA-3-methyladenine glycosylase [Methylotenera mobilis]ACT47046.1 DNA-3-methyladenine glycosylase II [Methylotenera mobilis JLW8]